MLVAQGSDEVGAKHAIEAAINLGADMAPQTAESEEEVGIRLADTWRIICGGLRRDLGAQIFGQWINRSPCPDSIRSAANCTSCCHRNLPPTGCATAMQSACCWHGRAIMLRLKKSLSPQRPVAPESLR